MRTVWWTWRRLDDLKDSVWSGYGLALGAGFLRSDFERARKSSHHHLFSRFWVLPLLLDALALALPLVLFLDVDLVLPVCFCSVSVCRDANCKADACFRPRPKTGTAFSRTVKFVSALYPINRNAISSYAFAASVL